MTSLLFMLWLVPAPAWKRSTTNWSACSPAMIFLQAATMASRFSSGSQPGWQLARAAASLIRTCASTKSLSGRRPEMGKLATARAVCAPNQASLGTLTSPSESFSIRNSFMMEK